MGHVDLKFSLHPLCTSPPHLQVTLLKQNISSIRRQAGGAGMAPPTTTTSGQDPGGTTTANSAHASANAADVDAKIDFNMETSVDSLEQNDDLEKTSAKIQNNVLSADWLEKHNAEVLCGPVDLANSVDLSRHSGLVTLTSPQLLKVKARSLLLHIKALPSDKDNDKVPVSFICLSCFIDVSHTELIESTSFVFYKINRKKNMMQFLK